MSLDIVYRQYTVQCLIDVAEQLNTPVGVSETPVKVNSKALDEHESRERSVRLTCSCPFITLSLPVHCDEVDATGNRIVPNENYEEKFARCGYPLQNVPVTSNAAIGIVFYHVSVDVVNEPCDHVDPTSDNLTTSFSECTSFSCDHVVLFVTYPSTSRSGIVSGMKRMDVLVFNGKVEVEPHVPVSIKYSTVSASQNGTSQYGRRAFPVVPALSAFKARQEDEENEIEDMYKSISSSARMRELQDMEMASGLRGTDPQGSMLLEAEKCSSVAEIHVPDIVGDLTQKEAHTLLQMLVMTTTKGRASIHRQVRTPKDEITPGSSSASWPRRFTGIALRCDHVCLAVHKWSAPPPNISNNGSLGSDEYSFALMGDGWKAHAVFDAPRLKNLRILAHEANFFEGMFELYCRFLACFPGCDILYGWFVYYNTMPVHDLVPGGIRKGGNTVAQESISDRCNSVRLRNRRNSSTSAAPIIYKSQMFSPISPESPAILVDIICPSLCGTSDEENCEEWNVFFTAYNMTYRYDVDSTWPERLMRLLKREEEVHDNIDGTAGTSATSEQINENEKTVNHNGRDGETLLTRVS